MFYPSDLVWVRGFNQREKQWLEKRTMKKLGSVTYLVQLKGHDSYVKKQVGQLRYQTIIETDKNSIQNKNDMTENQLDKPLSMFTLPDHLPLLPSELESQ